MDRGRPQCPIHGGYFSPCSCNEESDSDHLAQLPGARSQTAEDGHTTAHRLYNTALATTAFPPRRSPPFPLSSFRTRYPTSPSIRETSAQIQARRTGQQFLQVEEDFWDDLRPTPAPYSSSDGFRPRTPTRSFREPPAATRPQLLFPQPRHSFVPRGSGLDRFVASALETPDTPPPFLPPSPAPAAAQEQQSQQNNSPRVYDLPEYLAEPWLPASFHPPSPEFVVRAPPGTPVEISESGSESESESGSDGHSPTPRSRAAAAQLPQGNAESDEWSGTTAVASNFSWEPSRGQETLDLGEGVGRREVYGPPPAREPSPWVSPRPQSQQYSRVLGRVPEPQPAAQPENRHQPQPQPQPQPQRPEAEERGRALISVDGDVHIDLSGTSPLSVLERSLQALPSMHIRGNFYIKTTQRKRKRNRRAGAGDDEDEDEDEEESESDEDEEDTEDTHSRPAKRR
ncbi:hypothetical protein F4781DRAFT_259725 [Annulohypoxylon bovei var. microspora]|nr:hypothetical protein F4781DRAFT_259725 [Annulohypoxylon bovei var. microspora]